MDRIDAGFTRRLHDGSDIQIGFGGWWRTDQDRLIGHAHGQRVRISALCACTVRMPSKRAARMMRTAISPRLAMRREPIAIASDLDLGNDLTGHHRIGILEQKADGLSTFHRGNLMEALHDFDQAHDSPTVTSSPSTLKGGLSGEGLR